MIALKILCVVAVWILCGVLVYVLLMLCVGRNMTDEEKARRLLVCTLLAPVAFVLCVLSTIIFGLFKFCLFVVGHKQEENND